MSAEINAIIGGHERIAYTVEHRGNCVLITGAVPARALVTLTKLVSDEIHTYARNMNMTKYIDIVIHDLRCIGYSEKHIELSYQCDYLPDRTRYA